MTTAQDIESALGFDRKGGSIRRDSVEEFAKAALGKVDCDFDPTTRVEDQS